MEGPGGLRDTGVEERSADRRKLPRDRKGITHKFSILATNEQGEPEEVKGYLIIGFYPDGRVGEIFVKMAQQGSQVSGFVDSWAIAFSMILQLGVPMVELASRFKGMRFNPSGRIKDEPGVLALSPVDYIGKYLLKRFPEGRGTEEDLA